VPGYSVSNIEALQRTWNSDPANKQAQIAARKKETSEQHLDDLWL
jgi:hypothetical protein